MALIHASSSSSGSYSGILPWSTRKVIGVVFGMVAILLLLQQWMLSHHFQRQRQQQQQTLHSWSSSTKTTAAADAAWHGMMSNAAAGGGGGIRAQSKFSSSKENDNTIADTATAQERCAINFFGLPRAFHSLVLPSLVRNLIEPNAKYCCDYYVHYYHLEQEDAGRSGGGGKINPDDILELRSAVLDAAMKTPAVNSNRKDPPMVRFVQDHEEDFWKQYQPIIDKVRYSKDAAGHYLYFPWKARTYQHPVTTDNIIKMWHSIQSAYQLMERSALEMGQGITYTRVGMFRADVVYVSAIDIFAGGPALSYDEHNQYVMIPAFAKYPVNDRAVYGPAPAIKIWATERFTRMDDHVNLVLKTDPGWGLHSERFLDKTIFPAIRSMKPIWSSRSTVQLVEHPTMCFFRARADESVWINDCNMNAEPSVVASLRKDTRKVVEKALGRTCPGPAVRIKHAVSLNCASPST